MLKAQTTRVRGLRLD